MKIISNIIIGFFSIIIFILSFAFIIIEGRLLFSSDWLIYDNVIFGFMRYFFRLVLSIITCIYSILEFIKMKKKSKLINYILFIYNICLVIVSIVLIFIATNMVGEIALCISVIVLGLKFVFRIIGKNKLNSI